MRRNYYHDYKLLEGLLEWCFGSRVSLAYRYQAGGTGQPFPLVLVNGEVVERGRLSAGRIVDYIEGLGMRRLDNE